MKKLLTILSLVLFVICGVNVYSATKTTKKSSKGVRASSNKTSSARESRGRSGSAKSVRTGSSRSLRASAVSSASSDASTTDATATESKQTSEFAKCMDTICLSSTAEEKGRCRCSSQLPRIEKVLRDIDKITNEADEKNKNLETIMNVVNTSSVDETVGNVYENINTIEKKSKVMASKKTDLKTNVMEGISLYKEAMKQCKSYLSSKSMEEANAIKKDYDTQIETDCSAYTTVLKDKADNASNLLVQAQKNQEMFEEQEYKKLNQLSTDACYIEYESCMKTQCGENFTGCKNSAKRSANLKKCQAINYGKCEQNKSVVILQLQKFIDKMLEKERLAQNCRSSMGQIVNGKCMYRVIYVADSCNGILKSSSCGDMDEKWFLPGYRVTCADEDGDFRNLVDGCYESCYLVGSNKEQRYIGTNKSQRKRHKVRKGIFGVLTGGLSLVAEKFLGDDPLGLGLQCKRGGERDRYTLPVPDGWGSDGYPVSEEFKREF